MVLGISGDDDLVGVDPGPVLCLVGCAAAVVVGQRAAELRPVR